VVSQLMRNWSLLTKRGDTISGHFIFLGGGYVFDGSVCFLYLSVIPLLLLDVASCCEECGLTCIFLSLSSFFLSFYPFFFVVFSRILHLLQRKSIL
jgi:hypothetical protein